MVPRQRKRQGANGRPCSRSEHGAHADINGRVFMSISTTVKSVVQTLQKVKVALFIRIII